MAVSVLSIPRFYREQRVFFIGGVGVVKGQHCESGRWTYLVEMDMGPEPEIGRVGHETTIQLFESDLIALEESLDYGLAVG